MCIVVQLKMDLSPRRTHAAVDARLAVQPDDVDYLSLGSPAAAPCLYGFWGASPWESRT